MHRLDSTHQWKSAVDMPTCYKPDTDLIQAPIKPAGFIRLLSHHEITNSPSGTLTAPLCVIGGNCQWPLCTRKRPRSNFPRSFNDSRRPQKCFLRQRFAEWGYTSSSFLSLFFFFFFKPLVRFNFDFALLIWMNVGKKDSPVYLMGRHRASA